ncbi:MAG: hypothetical protein M1817_001901 [Caeruleum heppii]|nr:MAG: hypothetical protein M1817_001901 [Caeruleum heppii]
MFEELNENDDIEIREVKRISVNAPRMKAKQVRIAERKTDCSDEELALNTKKRPLQITEPANASFHQSRSSKLHDDKEQELKNKCGRLESQRYSPKNSQSNVRSAWSSSTSSIGSASVHSLNSFLARHPPSDGSEYPGDGREIFNALDEEALRGLPANLQTSLRALQGERVRRQGQMAATGTLRVVTPSEPGSPKSGKGKEKMHDDGAKELEDFVVVRSQSPRPSSGLATHGHRIGVNDSGAGGSSSQQPTSPIVDIKSQHSNAESEHIVPMKHWEAEAQRMALAAERKSKTASAQQQPFKRVSLSLRERIRKPLNKLFRRGHKGDVTKPTETPAEVAVPSIALASGPGPSGARPASSQMGDAQGSRVTTGPHHGNDQPHGPGSHVQSNRSKTPVPDRQDTPDSQLTYRARVEKYVATGEGEIESG